MARASLAAPALVAGGPQRPSLRARLLSSDRLLVFTLRALSLVAAAVTLLVILYVIAEAAPLLRKVGPLRFLTDADWAPTSGRFNLVPMLVGTFWAMLGAVLLATPTGIALAAFAVFYAPPRLATALRGVIALLAGVPSVVYGLWGLTTLVPIINRYRAPGLSLLAGILVLSIMILPTIATMADAAFTQVPASYLEGALALGVSRWAALRHVIVPAARSGLLTGVILEVGRAIGETMAVIMVVGNTVQYPSSLFSPMRTVTANIALEMSYALGDHRAALFVSGLALLSVIIGLVLLAEHVSRRTVHV